MPQGNYNISRLIGEFGLKNVTELPLARDIQAVIPLDSMRGQLPLHQGPVSLVGGSVPAAALEYSAIQLTSLDPGGLIVMGFSTIGGVLIFSVTTSQTPVVWGAVGPFAYVPTQFGRDPMQSVIQGGTTAAVPNPLTPTLLELRGDQYAPFHLPRGWFCLIQCVTVNSAFICSIPLMGIRATEGDPV
jgi:hypothetical protein